MLKKKPEIGQYAILTRAVGLRDQGTLVRIKRITPAYCIVENVYGQPHERPRFNSELEVLENEKDVFVHMLKAPK